MSTEAKKLPDGFEIQPDAITGELYLRFKGSLVADTSGSSVTVRSYVPAVALRVFLDAHAEWEARPKEVSLRLSLTADEVEDLKDAVSRHATLYEKVHAKAAEAEKTVSRRISG